MPPSLFRLTALALLVCAGASSARADDVTWERLLQAGSEAEAANWLMTNGDLGGHRYSPLSLLNRDTISGLRIAYSNPGQIGVGEIFENSRLSAPLVDDGMLYFTDGLGRVVKFDLSGGDPVAVWTSDAAFGQMHDWLAGQWNLALAGDRLLLSTGAGNIHWIDAATGEVARTTTVGDLASGYQLSAAPMVTGDRLLVGGAGTERGAALRMDAFNLADGADLWQTLPLAVDSDDVEAGTPGGSILRTGSFDPQSGLSYWTTGASLPSLTGAAPASSGTANTLMAIKPADGQVRWSRKLGDGAPDDRHSEAATPLVVPLLVGDEIVPKVVHVGDNGIFHRFDAASGELELSASFIERPESGPDDQAATCTTVLSEPHMPVTYSEATGLVYGAVNNTIDCEASNDRFAGETTLTGELMAIDPQSGEVRARRGFAFPLQSGLLSTAGGLVFAVTAEGMLLGLDDTTLETLWSFDLPSVRASPPITYAVDGRQYLAVLSGGGPFYSWLPFRPADMRGNRHLTVLVAFGLGGD